MSASNTAKNYLITGAARGLGRGLSRLLLQKGHRVFMVDNNQEELNHTVSSLEQSTNTNLSQGTNFVPCLCNLRNPSEIKDLLPRIKEFCHGELDVLINNAANTSAVGATHLSNLTLEEWQASIETNLTAPMLLSQGCLPLLQKSPTRSQPSGSIIHMSSTRAMQSELNNEPYSATKAGLLGLTQSMAVSLAPLGVRVNAILPGWINVTNECKAADEKGQSWEEGLSREDHEWQLTGRVGKVEDILKAVEYLVDNDGVTGSEVVVDGGVTRKMIYPD